MRVAVSAQRTTTALSSDSLAPARPSCVADDGSQAGHFVRFDLMYFCLFVCLFVSFMLNGTPTGFAFTLVHYTLRARHSLDTHCTNFSHTSLTAHYLRSPILTALALHSLHFALHSLLSLTSLSLLCFISIPTPHSLRLLVLFSHFTFLFPRRTR